MFEFLMGSLVGILVMNSVIIAMNYEIVKAVK